MPDRFEALSALAAADGDGTALMAVGVCCTVPGWAPGTVDSVTGAVVLVVVACAGPEEKATRPKTATAPTRAAGAASRAATERRGVVPIT